VSSEWQNRYARKTISAQRAIAQIRPGERIYLSAGSAAPHTLIGALVAPDAPLGDNEIIHLLTLGDAPYTRPEFAKRFRHRALFIGPNVRQAVTEGRADYTPVFLSEIPGLIRRHRIPIDVAVVSVSPPDAEGFCTFGTHIDLAPAATSVARLVIGQVNRFMPRTCGPARIHVDAIHWLVEGDHPLPELARPKRRPETEAIARHIADLIPDGATLQLGIGGIPDGVMEFLHDRKDLGIHTEMFSDGVVDLIERGVINGKNKTLHAGKAVASFTLASEKTYRFLDGNDLFEMREVDYTNDPFVIAQHDNMIAINTCLEVDLTGQVCSDSIGTRFYSGIGGQVDFIRGAARSKGGKPIIAMPSTARDGIVSRIVPHMDDGAGIVTTRGDVHWVVTEYGAVNLHGLTVRERAMALISIAHPKFRPWLIAEAKRLNFIYADQLELPLRTPEYPRQLETEARANDGTVLRVRAIRPTDESLLRELFYKLSHDTVYQRFFSVKKYMPHENLQRFCTIDYDRDMTVVACLRRGDDDQVVAWASYNVDPDSGYAESSFVVDDAWQGRGIGTLLMRRLTEIAEARSIRGFTAAVLADNGRMLRVFEKCGYPIERKLEGDVIALRIPFEGVRQAWSGGR